jgi:hypothetical protein
VTIAAARSVVDSGVIERLVDYRSRQAESPLRMLSGREIEVLREMAEGKSNASIAGTHHVDPASVMGAVVIAYALLAYPAIEMLGGHKLSTLPVFGLSPCATVIFFFGLLLWARPPAPKYLLLLPLAWALNAAPANQAAGFVPDIGLIVAGVGTAALVIWRDRKETWQTVAAGLLLALMIGWSGHDDVLIGIAAILAGVTVWQTLGDSGARDRPAAGSPRAPAAIP